MRNGSGVKATVWTDGKLVEFKLALVIDKRYSWKNHKFGFVTDDLKQITFGFYSGGETGFGRDVHDVYEINPEEYEVVTTDLDEIIEFQRKEKEENERERAEIEAKNLAWVEALNSLPERTTVLNHPVHMEMGLHDKAWYNPVRSGKVHYYLDVFVAGEKVSFSPSNYRDRNNTKTFIKAFIKDFPELCKTVDPKVLYNAMTVAYENFSAQLRALYGGKK